MKSWKYVAYKSLVILFYREISFYSYNLWREIVQLSISFIKKMKNLIFTEEFQRQKKSGVLSQSA